MLLLQELLLLLNLYLNLANKLHDAALFVFCDLLDMLIQFLHVLRSLHLNRVILVHLLNESYFACCILAASKNIDIKELVGLFMIVEGYIVYEF